MEYPRGGARTPGLAAGQVNGTSAGALVSQPTLSFALEHTEASFRAQDLSRWRTPVPQRPVLTTPP